MWLNWGDECHGWLCAGGNELDILDGENECVASLIWPAWRGWLACFGLALAWC